MDGFRHVFGNKGAARVETIEIFLFVVVDGEAFWCCQWPVDDRTAIAVRMGQFSFNQKRLGFSKMVLGYCLGYVDFEIDGVEGRWWL